MLSRREYLLGSAGAAAIAALGGCATAPAVQPIQDALRRTVGEREDQAGAVAVVVNEGGSSLVAHGSSGVPNLALDADAVFEIGSITKVLTALLLADMAERGEVGLDDPVTEYIPPSVALVERGRPITLLDLATYTSGLPTMPGNLPPNWWASPDPFADYTTDKLYEFLSVYEPQYAPGERYQYSNVGFALLGDALARRAGKRYEALLIERVCEPLGLQHTRITLSNDMEEHLAQGHDVGLSPTAGWDMGSGLQGAGAARSNAKDLTALLEACMGFTRTPLSASFSRLLETRRPTGLAGTDAGFGWFISSNESEEIVWKSGLTGGFNTFIGYSPQRRRGALVLFNCLWEPVDVGTINLGVQIISPDFNAGDVGALYR
jgi:CubicO group peptidase (beta-lactamase class C family)